MVQTRFFVRGITFKTSKNQLFLSYCTFLPKFRYGTTKPQKRMWYYWKMKILLSVSSTQFELCLIQKWSLVLFPLVHNLTSKTGIFSNLQMGKMEILTTTSNWLFNWFSWLSALKKFILSIGQVGILNLCQTDFWASSDYQFIMVCFIWPKVLRRQMLDIKCKKKLWDTRN